jgi:hypothetical protein
MSSNYLYKMFKASNQAGLEDDILFVKSEAHTMQTFTLFHKNHDAISGMISLLKQNYSLENFTVSIPKREKPSIFNILCSFFGKQDNAKNVRNFTQGSNIEGNGSFHFLTFSPDELLLIKKNSSAAKASLNSFLIYNFHLSVQAHLSEVDFDDWMVPISLYHKITLQNDSGNKVTFVNLKIKKGQKPEDIDEDIKNIISSNQHWRRFLVVNLISLLPEKFLVKAISRNVKKFSRLGVFSNIGAWEVPEASKDIWGFCPPTAHNQLVSCGVMTFNNSLSFTYRTARPDIINDEKMRLVGASLKKRLLDQS